MENIFFNSHSGKRLLISELVEEIVCFLKENPLKQYKIMIGTDSEQLAGGRADFVTAVVVHRVGNGGRYFWRRIEFQKVPTMRDRIIKEVLISIEVAKNILQELRKFPLPDFDFEIHADIGERGPTKAMIQEIAAMIRGNNFEVKIKPESYAATNVADRYV